MEEVDTSKRATIIRRCARLFRENSYRGTSMADIAAVMELNKGTLYYYFPSKSDILNAIYVEGLNILEESIEKVPPDLPPDEALVAYVRVVLRTVSDLPDFVTVYFQERPWLDQSISAEQADAVREREQRFSARLRDIIAQGVSERVFRRVNPELLATQILAMVSSSYRWNTSRGDQGDLVADTLMSYLLEGVLNRP